MNRKKKKYQVVIIGKGITGLSAAYHLQVNGVEDIAVISSGQESATLTSAGLLYGGLADNFSRWEHAYGRDFAKEVWQFGDQCLLALLSFMNEKSKLAGVPRYRLLVSDQEVKEAGVATLGLSQSGFNTQMYMRGDSHIDWSFFGDRVLGIQEDSSEGYIVDIKSVWERLMTPLKGSIIQDKVLRITPLSDGVEIGCQTSDFKAEMVILACHYNMIELLPQLETILIPYGDQWLDVKVSWHLEPPSMIYSAHHGYEWGGFSQDSCRIGGGRFLRKYAGIGEKESSNSAKSTAFLQSQVLKTFPMIDQVEVSKAVGSLGIRPCDEIPLIGPMYHDSRILVSTGYMGSGLAMGYGGGKALSELVLTGKCTWLPYRLHPKRLRTMES